jgi:hypothetical protein
MLQSMFTVIGRLLEINGNTVTVLWTESQEPHKEHKVFIDMSDTILDNVKQYCKHGDIMGIKGSVHNQNALVADKVTFLSSTRNTEEEDGND